MKALELTIYPPIHRPRFTYGGDPYGDQWKRERKLIESKRLTDAELAADYWKLMSGLYDGHGKVTRMRRDTLHRFATLPHYDEDQP